MTRPIEEDFPPGHPGRSDWNPESPEAQEWARVHVLPLGERDFPHEHPKALDTAGNLNHIPTLAGADPLNPHREPFTGRTPIQAEAVKRLSIAASVEAKESPVVQPIDAAVVNKMLDAKRTELRRDLLTPEEYASVLRDYHAQRTSGVEQAREEMKLTRREEAISYVMSRGYAVDVATVIVNTEGEDRILKGAGIE
jgi:hypothetical protein